MAAAETGSQDAALDRAILPLIALVLVYAVLLAVGGRLLNDPDTYLHVAAGRWIWAHGAVPATDPFSATVAGGRWVAHEWLSEVLLAGAYGALGAAGAVALVALAAAASLAILIRTLLNYVRPPLALAAAALAFFLMAAHLTARPHALALPALALWAAGLVEARAEDRRPSLALLPVMLLWANLHGGFVVGLGLAGALAVEAVLLAPDAAVRGKALRGWGLFLVGAALASLLTPQGIEGWLFPIELMRQSFSLSFVNEWRAPDFSTLQPLELWLLALLGFGFWIGLRVPPFRLLLLLGLIHMALSRARNADLLALLAPLLLADAAARATEPAESAEAGTPGPRPVAALLMALALLTIGAAYRGYTQENPRIAPTAALAAAAQVGLSGPVFNDYDFGDYLIFRGFKPAVDGRFDVYGDAFMRDYSAALDAEGDALQHFLDRYKLGWSLLKPDVPAVAALDRMPNWQRIYADPAAVVHRRR
ncbi:MAG TPA: hypothetical protein VK433_09275 [Stellaceae bacterium]|nr:hypothetical protein [Stellaceae bacterium]